MARISELIVKIGADSTAFERGIASAQKSALKFSERLSAIGSTLTTSLSIPLGGIGALAVRSAAQFDSLTRGMTVVTKSATAAAAEMEKLKKVAELPGLGFKEAVQGSINLQAVGFTADRSREILLQFGNALAAVGRGREDLNEVIRQLGQLASRGKVTADNLKPIIERVPQVAAIIKEQFGTIDTEALQKLGVSSEEFISVLIRELSKVPRVTGGLANDLENLRDKAERALADMGKAAAPGVSALIDAITPALATVSALAKGFSELPAPVQQATAAIIALAVTAGPISTLVANLQKLQVLIIGIGAKLAASPLLAGIVLGVAGAGTAIAITNDNLNKLKENLDRAGQGSLDFQEKLKDPEFLAVVKAQVKDMGDLGVSVSRVGQQATVSGSALNAAFAGLGVTSTQALNKQLAEARQHLELIRTAVSTGQASQRDLAVATAAVDDIQKKLNETAKKTADHYKAIPFAEKSKEGAIFAASIGSLVREQAKLLEQLVELRATGPSVILDAPELLTAQQRQDQLTAQIARHTEEIARGFDASTKETHQLVFELERAVRQADLLRQGVAAIPEAVDPVREAFEKATIQARGQRGVELAVGTGISQLEIAIATRRFEDMQRVASQLGRRIQSDISGAIVQSISRAESLGEAFQNVAHRISADILQFAINQGLKLLARELSGVIGQFGKLGKAIADVIGGTASAAGQAAGAVGAGAGAAGQAAGAVSAGVGAAASGLTGVVGAVSGVATAIFSALQFTQLRRIEQDVGRIEVTARGGLSQSIAIQETLNKWLPLLDSMPWLQSIDGTLKKIYEGLSAIDFGALRSQAGAGAVTIQTATFIVPPGSTRQQMQAIARELRAADARF